MSHQPSSQPSNQMSSQPSSQHQLNSYIARLQRRLRLSASLRGLAILFGTALLVTIALVFILNAYAFPAHAVSGARLFLFLTLAAVLALCIAFPILRLSRARAVSAAEATHPELQQRLTTFHESSLAEHTAAAPDPFLPLLAADTLAHTEALPPSALAPGSRLFALGGVALGCLCTLVWMIASGPGYLGYGASLLWTGPKPNQASLYAIAVTPGDVAVRRNTDQLITAEVTGMHPEKVQLFARYQSGSAWEPVLMQGRPMQTGPDAGRTANYQFLFSGLPESVEYYVAAGPLVSPHYRVRVVDLPSVKGIRVTYHYPKWTGMEPTVEEHSGDLRAIEGTDATVEIETDRPLNDPQIALDGDHTLRLTGGEGNHYKGSIHMEKDGAYHLAATDAEQAVRLSEDFFIATDKATPPQIAIDRPAREYRASPIEEVTIGVKASDQFALRSMNLHYSVNGGPDRELSLLKAPGAKSADGAYTLRLEDFKLVPGDLVSLYATAKDGHAEARTDISFIQADPFEREFSQSQQSGGSGSGSGGGNSNQTEMSKREKELIDQTWKQTNSSNSTPKDASAAGQFLSEAQAKLRGEVMALSARMQSRDLSGANEEFTGFEKDMQVAAAAMAPSADKLKGMQWKEAMPLEQKALQALLRAEATFRKIQVAFGQQSGGGGGGGSAGRDLASLFDLELDTEKNQYETAASASPAEQHEKAVEDALAKLDALAKRQEDLASQQPNPQQAFQQRWQQEMLRREAEQLQQQMEQLAKNEQAQQQQGSGQSSSQSSGKSSSGQSGSSQSSSGSQPAGSSSQTGQGQSSAGNRQSSGASQDRKIEQALSRLRQAGDTMKRSSGAQASQDSARQAANRLREAADLLGGTQQQLASGKLDALSREADRLTEEERAQSERINHLAGQRSGQGGQPRDSGMMDRDAMLARARDRNRLAEDRQQLSTSLSKLQKDVRDAAREIAPNQPGAARKLRDALTEMDQSDLDNHVQRTADWLRRGINPNSNGTEAEIAQGLGKLDQQLRQAQGAMGQGGTRPGKADPQGTTPGDSTAALGQVERLRSQVEAMAALSRNGSDRNSAGKTGNGSQDQGRQNGRQGGQRNNQGSSQQAQSGSGAQSGNGSGTQPGGANRNNPSGNQAGQQSGQQAATGSNPANRNGEVRTSGGGAEGLALGNFNTGNNRYGQPGQRPAPPDASGNPADTERTFQQGMRELNQLRQMVGTDPQAAKELQQLARQMQQLDPSRFPGNPQLVEQMHRDVLSSVDRLELALQRNSAATDARTGRPYVVPSGYQDSVADYYRRLSKKP